MPRASVNSDLVEFAFESRVNEALSQACLTRLARQTWSQNTRLGLTGELRLQDGRFVQVVEGRCADVVALAARILSDGRHSAIRVLAIRPLAARRHEGWTVVGFESAAPAQPTADNLRFLQARAAARALEVGVPAS